MPSTYGVSGGILALTVSAGAWCRVHSLVLVAVALIPGMFWVWFFNRQDSEDREPLGLLLRCFLYGMIAVGAAALAEIAFSPVMEAATHPVNHLIALIVGVGLVEESAKFAAFHLAVHREPAYNEPVDGIIYAVTAALGFSTLENLIYTASFGLSVAPLRAMVASVAHAAFSGIVGYYAAMVKFRDRPRRTAWAGLGLASVLHGFYNFFIVDASIPAWLVVPLVYGVYRFLIVRIQKARALSSL